MYIPMFLAGVLTTLMVEIVSLIIWGAYLNTKERKRRTKKND